MRLSWLLLGLLLACLAFLDSDTLFADNGSGETASQDQSTYDCDINKDGLVDVRDLEFLAIYWLDNRCPRMNWCEGLDFNHSGTVGIDDLAIMAANWKPGE